MRKFLAISAMFFVFAALLPVSVKASSGENRLNNLTYGNNYNNYQRNRYYQRNRRQSNRRYYSNRYNRRYYNNRSNYRYGRDRRSVYRRHRNAFNIGIGGASGAILGGILGGRRGALIGAGVGAGAGAAYTYGIRPKKKRTRYYRRY